MKILKKKLFFLFLVALTSVHPCSDAGPLSLEQRVFLFQENAYFNYLHVQNYFLNIPYDLLDSVYTPELSEFDISSRVALSQENLKELYQPVTAAKTVWLSFRILLNVALSKHQKNLVVLEAYEPEYKFIKKILAHYISSIMSSPQLTGSHPVDSLIKMLGNAVMNTQSCQEAQKKIIESIQNQAQPLLEYLSNTAQKPFLTIQEIFYIILVNDILAFLYISELLPSEDEALRDENYKNHLDAAYGFIKKYSKNFKNCQRSIFSKQYKIFRDIKKIIHPVDKNVTLNHDKIDILECLVDQIEKKEKNNFFFKYHDQLAEDVFSLYFQSKSKIFYASKMFILRSKIILLFLTLGHPKDVIRNISFLFDTISYLNDDSFSNESSELEFQKNKIDVSVDALAKKNLEKNIFLKKEYLYFMIEALKKRKKSTENIKKNILEALRLPLDLTTEDYINVGKVMLYYAKDELTAKACFDEGACYVQENKKPEEILKIIYYYQDVLSVLSADEHALIMHQYIDAFSRLENLDHHHKLTVNFLSNIYTLILSYETKRSIQRNIIQASLKNIMQEIFKCTEAEKLEINILMQRLLEKLKHDPMLSLMILFYSQQWSKAKDLGLEILKKAPNLPHDLSLDLIRYYVGLAFNHLDEPLLGSEFLEILSRKIAIKPGYELNHFYDSISNSDIYIAHAIALEKQKNKENLLYATVP